MTRPSEVTRDRIMKAAERLFAEKGYDGTSIRAIVAKARVNQAAINYHFDGKEGLYREVLRAAFRALTEHQLAHAKDVKTMSREEALAEFLRRHLADRPMQRVSAQSRAACRAPDQPCPRRGRSHLAFRHDQRLGCRRPGPARLGRDPKNRECRKNSFFRASLRPERLFEI